MSENHFPTWEHGWPTRAVGVPTWEIAFPMWGDELPTRNHDLPMRDKRFPAWEWRWPVGGCRRSQRELGWRLGLRGRAERRPRFRTTGECSVSTWARKPCGGGTLPSLHSGLASQTAPLGGKELSCLPYSYSTGSVGSWAAHWSAATRNSSHTLTTDT